MEKVITRRRVLQDAGCAIAAAAFPSVRLIGGQSESPISAIMSKLSAYMAEASRRALPGDVVENAKQHILDTLAAMISGSELPPGRTALQFARAYGGKEVATVVASNFLCGPIEAALTNGMLAHADETDDSHSPSQSHPGCAVIPAAFGVGRSGRLDRRRRHPLAQRQLFRRVQSAC